LRPDEAVGLEQGRLPGQPGEAPLHGAPGDLQDPRRLPQPDAGDQELQARRIEERLLLAAVGAKASA